MVEEWAETEVKGYFVSNMGRVRSPKKILSTGGPKSKSGYRVVTLGNRIKIVTVHRLVAAAFIPNPLNKKEVNHKNGIKYDNRADNLEWCTRSENQIHACQNNLYPIARGSKHPASKITEDDVKIIRDLYKSGGYTQEYIAHKFGISRVNISDIVNNKAWKHVTA